MPKRSATAKEQYLRRNSTATAAVAKIDIASRAYTRARADRLGGCCCCCRRDRAYTKKRRREGLSSRRGRYRRGLGVSFRVCQRASERAAKKRVTLKVQQPPYILSSAAPPLPSLSLPFLFFCAPANLTFRSARDKERLDEEVHFCSAVFSPRGPTSLSLSFFRVCRTRSNGWIISREMLLLLRWRREIL